MKRSISILLALTLVLSLTVAVCAADVGSITINGVTADTEYAIYRLLDLESYDKTAGTYAYELNTAWEAFFKTGYGKDFVKIEDGYVTWTGAEDDATMATFAQKALEYAKANHIDPVKSSKNTGEFVVTGTSGKFSNLPLGWYLVDSTAGALCGITTTDPDASINAKNGTPTIEKQVKEDLTGMWGEQNTADIGQIVEYMSIIHAAPGAEKYVMHDIMSDGLTFEHKTADGRGVTKITHTNSLGDEAILIEGTHYVVKYANCKDTACDHSTHAVSDTDCDFEVIFTDTFCATLKANDRIIVYYNAMLNRHALIGTGTGNTNESKLEYGEAHHVTPEDKTTTYTFSIDIVKTDSSNNLIDGAKFRIYDAATGGNEIKVVPLMNADDSAPVLDTNNNPMYRRARADETGVEIEVKDGKVTVVGFDNGVYYLEETVAPAGYNKLTSRKEFTIADGNLDSVFNDGIYSTGSGVHVVNKNGTMLPETGAEGTFLFITLGMILVLGTGVLLVTKKRMSMIVE